MYKRDIKASNSSNKETSYIGMSDSTLEVKKNYNLNNDNKWFVSSSIISL